MWWLNDPQRLKREVAEIEALRDREPWFTAVVPRLRSNLRFAVDFDISVNGEAFPLVIEYPAFFPETPPMVTPRDGRRLSSHQYGADGELCLEYRSDNWDPTITGAMMIESAYRLIAGERPDVERRAEVPSAHQTSEGQRLRGNTTRFLLTPGFLKCAAEWSPGDWRRGKVVETYIANRNFVAHISSAGDLTIGGWSETAIPERGGFQYDLIVVRVPELAPFLGLVDQSHVDGLVASVDAQAPELSDSYRGTYFLVLTDGRSAVMFSSFRYKEKRAAVRYVTIELGDRVGERTGNIYARLTGKKVGIVGCGSLGSKIAVSLARSGVVDFVLVDDDVVKSGNLERNELDGTALGEHKVDALETRLKAVSAGVRVSSRRVRLGGQEASGGTASVMDELGTCDLLIDASADSQAFNFVAAVARATRRPMVWAEVYAGGVGGFVARVRPGVEPPPHAARRQYLKWCEQQGVPWNGDAGDYEVRNGDDPPAVATDADVTVIAAHATRMAIDTLAEVSNDNQGHSAYVIGLSKAWIFDGPFDTRPIIFVPQGEWGPEMRAENAAEAVTYIVSLLADRTRE